MEAKKINDSNKELKMKQRIRCLIIICFIIMIILIIVIFLKNKKLFNNQDIIKGLWNIDGTTKYEFDGKGEGKMILPSSEYKFIYKITENEISIDFEDETAKDYMYTYSLNGDVLEFKGKSKGALDFELKREK